MMTHVSPLFMNHDLSFFTGGRLRASGGRVSIYRVYLLPLHRVLEG